MIPANGAGSGSRQQQEESDPVARFLPIFPPKHSFATLLQLIRNSRL
jgi:hypothetical protein